MATLFKTSTYYLGWAPLCWAVRDPITSPHLTICFLRPFLVPVESIWTLQQADHEMAFGMQKLDSCLQKTKGKEAELGEENLSLTKPDQVPAQEGSGGTLEQRLSIRGALGRWIW